MLAHFIGSQQTMPKNPQLNRRQLGYTLLEIMLSTAIASIAMAGIMTFFVNTVHSNSTELKTIHLSQELRALMDVMVRDIRRAGYWRHANGIQSNMYATGENIIAVTGKTCITYSYDNYLTRKSIANRVQASDSAGFRLSNGTIKVRKRSASCTSRTNWESLSDISTIRITKLEFKINSHCTNVSSQLQVIKEQRGCGNRNNFNQFLPPLVNDTLSTMNVVTIILSGELASDPKISSTDILETVLIRNSITI